MPCQMQDSRFHRLLTMPNADVPLIEVRLTDQDRDEPCLVDRVLRDLEKIIHAWNPRLFEAD